MEGGIEELLGGFGIQATDEFCRVFEIGKEHGDLLALACEGGPGRDNFLGEVCGGIGARPDVGWARPNCRRCCPVAGPDQDGAILINGHLLGLDELDLEIVEGVIVQVELPFERAIGHAASTLEHGQGLVHNLLEGHRRPSTALALVPRKHNVRYGGVCRERTPRVYQEYGAVAGEIAPLYRDHGLGAMGKSGKSFIKQELACRPRSPQRVTP
jgi:hypothetical protein